MSKNTFQSFLYSFLWIAFFIIVIQGFSIIISLIFIDFIHGNPHRPKSNAVVMMFIFPLLTGIVALIGTFLVFIISQIFQAGTLLLTERRYGLKAVIFLAFTLPLTTLVTWYCYDYLTPSEMNFGFNAPEDWTPYKHGLTGARYLKSFVAQLLITIFNVLYWISIYKKNIRKPLLFTTLIIAILVGSVWGYVMAINQYKFL